MKNPMYLQYEWFSGSVALTDVQINNYLSIMANNGINIHFCDIGVLNDDGTLPAAGYTQLSHWITVTRANAAKFKVVPVLNYGKRKTNTNFGNSTFNSNLDAVITNLFTSFNIDGIHLDIEGFIDNDSTYLATLQYLKANSCQGKPLSLATPDFWNAGFITQVAGVVEQINPMIYDTMGWGSVVVDAKTYETYFHDKLKKYTDATVDMGCEVVPIFPAYEKKMSGTVCYHDPVVEKMSVAIAATRRVMFEGGKIHGAGIFYGPNFMGINTAVYKYHPTDQDQWQNNWLIQ